MESNKTELLTEVANYYSSKLAEYGETPQGVDWNGEEGQELRFIQLCKVVGNSEKFSVNDLGCGYGALLEYIERNHQSYTYLGVDVSKDMITASSLRHQENKQANFIAASEPNEVADYGMASGIFNVRLGRSDHEWRSYLEATLDILDRSSRLGFSFNCLTSYSDSERMRDYLYYADPCEIFDLCKRRYSRNVAILHDYDLYEFTILVKK